MTAPLPRAAGVPFSARHNHPQVGFAITVTAHNKFAQLLTMLLTDASLLHHVPVDVAVAVAVLVADACTSTVAVAVDWDAYTRTRQLSLSLSIGTPSRLHVNTSCVMVYALQQFVHM